MARFFGNVGYVQQEEITPGRWEDVPHKRPYYGDVIRNSRQIREGDKVLPDVVVDNSISVVADAYLINNFHNIRYVEWAGSAWTVTNVTVDRPRLSLKLGGIYNGPKA